MNKVIITSDSTCDLTPELLERYNIRFVPLYIVMNDRSYRDVLDVKPDDIYENYEKTKKLPTTSATTVGDYLDFFKPLIDEGYEIVHLSLSSHISATHQNACLAAAELNGVYVIDSKSLSTGTSLLAIEAAEMAENGVNGSDIAAKISKRVEACRTSFVIHTLEYLHKGGRCSTVAALGANLLKLRPCIEMTDGKMEVGKKYRGAITPVLEEYVSNKLSGVENIKLDRVFITHSGIADEHIEAVKSKIKEYANFKEILVTRAGCVISNHCGPNTLGILFMSE